MSIDNIEPWLAAVEASRSPGAADWQRDLAAEASDALTGLYASLGHARACARNLRLAPDDVREAHEKLDKATLADAESALMDAEARLWAAEARGGDEWMHRLGTEAENMLTELRAALDWCEADPANRPIEDEPLSPDGFAPGECDYYWLFWRRTNLFLLALGVREAGSGSNVLVRMEREPRLAGFDHRALERAIFALDPRLKKALKGRRTEGWFWLAHGLWWMNEID